MEKLHKSTYKPKSIRRGGLMVRAELLIPASFPAALFFPQPLALAGSISWLVPCQWAAGSEGQPEQPTLPQTPELSEVPESEAPRLPYEPTSHYQVRELCVARQVLVHRHFD